MGEKRCSEKCKESLAAPLQLDTQTAVHYGNAVFQDRAAPKHCHVVVREGLKAAAWNGAPSTATSSRSSYPAWRRCTGWCQHCRLKRRTFCCRPPNLPRKLNRSRQNGNGFVAPATTSIKNAPATTSKCSLVGMLSIMLKSSPSTKDHRRLVSTEVGCGRRRCKHRWCVRSWFQEGRNVSSRLCFPI